MGSRRLGHCFDARNAGRSGSAARRVETRVAAPDQARAGVGGRSAPDVRRRLRAATGQRRLWRGLLRARSRHRSGSRHQAIANQQKGLRFSNVLVALTAGLSIVEQNGILVGGDRLARTRFASQKRGQVCRRVFVAGRKGVLGCFGVSCESEPHTRVFKMQTAPSLDTLTVVHCTI